MNWQRQFITVSYVNMKFLWYTDLWINKHSKFDTGLKLAWNKEISLHIKNQQKSPVKSSSKHFEMSLETIFHRRSSDCVHIFAAINIVNITGVIAAFGTILYTSSAQDTLT